MPTAWMCTASGQIWFVYDKTYVDLNQRKYFAVYAGRRNGKNYIHTPEEIRERYRDQIVMDEDIPEIISGAMGDHMWTARLDTEEQKDEFIDFVRQHGSRKEGCICLYTDTTM